MSEAAKDLSVAETARIVGVSRARVYQRIADYDGDNARSLEAVTRESKRPGTRDGRQLRIPIAVALSWRAEREAAGQIVGVVPPEVSDQLLPPPPIPPSAEIPVGLPAFRPF